MLTMAGTFDLRKIVILIGAVLLVYWLLLPRDKEESIVVRENSHAKDRKSAPSKPSSANIKQGITLSAGKGPEKAEPSSRAHNDRLKAMRAQITDYETEIEAARARIRELEFSLSEAKTQISVSKNSVKKPTSDKVTFDANRLIHLDLKGGAPKMEYLMELIPLIKRFGGTGFLIEYEDMFPYTGNYSILRSKHAYTEKELRDFLDTVIDENLIVVPLIQTFGHLEYVLKHKKFADIRETPEMTNAVCPLHKRSSLVVKGLIKQMMDFHKGLKWIHLGGDEVWNLKYCKKCLANSKSAGELYLHHMSSLFAYVNKYSKGQVKSIIWDDMMRNWSVADMKQIARDVEPMVWAYVADVERYHKFPDGMWDRYTKAFSSIWFASSFKGALKPTSNFVPLEQHIDNHLSWLKILAKLNSKIKIQGIALTGWSRFDHYGPLCELLPAGIPSMAICLGILGKGEFSSELHQSVSKQLGFAKPFSIHIPAFIKYIPEDATYPGHDVYKLVGDLERALNWFYVGQHRFEGWARPFQVKSKQLSFYHLNATVTVADVCLKSLIELKKSARSVLKTYFKENTVNEWIDDKIAYGYDAARLLKEKATKAMKSHKFL